MGGSLRATHYKELLKTVAVSVPSISVVLPSLITRDSAATGITYIGIRAFHFRA